MKEERDSTFMDDEYIKKYNSIIAAKIGKEIKDRNLKQSYIAVISGVSESHLSDIINFISIPTTGILIRIVNALGYDTLGAFHDDIPELNKPFSEIK